MYAAAKTNLRRKERRSATRAAMPRRRWNVSVNVWLIVVLAIFAWVRIWQSSSVAHLLKKLARH
jgi:hypothetical protein